MQYTNPDQIPYPAGTDTIANKSGDWILKLFADIAARVQAGFVTRDSVSIRVRGSADGLDLNDLYKAQHLGTWDVLNGGSLNLPSDYAYRGALEVVGSTIYGTYQRVSSRDLNRVWQRTCLNPTTTPVQWSEWVANRLPDKSATGALAMIGDSLAASHNLAESLNSLLPGVDVYKRAWNGETSDGILWRLGALRSFWTVAGGIIPSGTTPVTITTTQTIALPDFSTVYSGDLNGVPGRIAHDGAGGFVFTRSTTGSAKASAGRVLFDPTWLAATKNHMLGVIMGRNDVSLGSVGVDADVASHVAGNNVKLINWMNAQEKIFFLMGTINRTTEPAGSAGHATVVAINNLVRGLFPGNFIDVRRYLIDRCIHDLGITPTAGDLANMANDCPPPSVMFDQTHYTDAAAAKISEKLLKPWLIGKGHYVP